jgi:hypothetical protein
MVPGIILFALRAPIVCECLGRLTVTLAQPDRGFAHYPLHENSPPNQNSPFESLGATWPVNLIQGRKDTTSEKFSTVGRVVRGR